jgi:protein involved in sex pheromone biosynthesis
VVVIEMSVEGKSIIFVIYIALVIIAIAQYEQSPKGFIVEGDYICKNITVNASEISQGIPEHSWTVVSNFTELNKKNHDTMYIFRNFTNGKVYIGYKQDSGFIIAEIPYQQQLGAVKTVNIDNNRIKVCYDIPDDYMSHDDLEKITLLSTTAFLPFLIFV